jgi:hypothetical protein
MSTPKSPNARPLNVSYLVVGLIFLGIAGSWALHASGAVDTGDVQWLMPLVLVGAGVIGLVAFTAKGLTRGRDEAVPDQEPALDLYGDSYEAEQTEQTEIQPEQTTRIEGEDR